MNPPSRTRLPSVTEILKAAGYTPYYPPGSEVKRDLGTRRHEQVAFWLLGQAPLLDYRPLMPLLEPLIRPEEAILVESRLTSSLGFTGQLDALRRRAERHAVLDWKFGQFDASHALQSAAYALLAGERLGINPLEIERAMVYCTCDLDGRWRVVPKWFDDPADFAYFKAALLTVRWRALHRGWEPPARTFTDLETPNV